MPFSMHKQISDRMIGPGEIFPPGKAPKGNAKTLRQKGRAMTMLRRVQSILHAEGATCLQYLSLWQGISQVHNRRHKVTTKGSFVPFFIGAETFPPQMSDNILRRKYYHE